MDFDFEKISDRIHNAITTSMYSTLYDFGNCGQMDEVIEETQNRIARNSVLDNMFQWDSLTDDEKKRILDFARTYIETHWNQICIDAEDSYYH